ncbi:MAG: class I SAM-dependent methyltransferase [Cyclobacteriaceae bacterium]|nr:class I SAM-dependent methyltransferase [Cyclobacteriaceae bacterium]
MNLKLLHPASWSDYELIDSGEGEKLERFGSYILIRPEPQAIWSKVLSEKEWSALAHARFDREQKDRYRFADEVKGGWKKLKSMPESWPISYSNGQFSITLRLALTGFGHVGVFPEQGVNWNFIYETIRGFDTDALRVLNLFAYTGAASIVACKAGAEVTHVDASRPGLNWANQNMQLNKLGDIRWVYEDAFKFVKREVKRGKKYNGIIMDPPPYGRGPEGEKWTLHEQLNELVRLCSELIEQKKFFFILNMYAAGLPALVGLNIAKTYFSGSDFEWGEFYLKSAHNRHLPMGTFFRMRG